MQNSNHISWTEHHRYKIKEVLQEFLLSSKKDKVVIHNFCKSFFCSCELSEFPDSCHEKLQYIRDKIFMNTPVAEWDTVRTPFERGIEENLNGRVTNNIKRNLWDVYHIMMEKK
jgi:hypothetical protein